MLCRNAQLPAKRPEGVSLETLWLPRCDSSRTGAISSSLSAGAHGGQAYVPSFIHSSILNFISREKEFSRAEYHPSYNRHHD